MNGIFREIRQSLLLGLAAPLMIVGIGGRLASIGNAPSFSRADTDAAVRVSILEDGERREMTLEAYLNRVVMGEMPVPFEMEALKAQAVAARTYTCRVLRTGGKHDGALCTDSTCCQAFCQDAAYEGQSLQNREKIAAAVRETDGLVLAYGESLIEAPYFSCSGGRTEDAMAVWGVDYPYLRSVDSPGEEAARYDRDSVTFSGQEIEERLGISLGEDRTNWLGAAEFTSGGGVESIVLGGKQFTGTSLRRLLGLRSTAFTATLEQDGIRFDTRGYGHRVGLSQYGANAMASGGKTFQEILEHYYPGTVLLNYSEFVEKQGGM